MLGNSEYLEVVAGEKKHTFISTGMSTIEEIDAVVAIFKKHNCPFELMHCNSTYPTNLSEANISVINTLRDRYNCNVGISSHETGSIATLGAVALGVTSVERHVTLDRSMYGSDQHSSLESEELIKLVKDIKMMEMALGKPEKNITENEMPIRKKLRG